MPVVNLAGKPVSRWQKKLETDASNVAVTMIFHELCC
jgi:hypothetical protein